MPKRVFLGMSGGVDSSVSAILLKEQGYDVTGVYMKNWSEDLPGMKCPWAEDLADAKRVAVGLDLDFEVWDFEAEYKAKVVDYMLAEFKKGHTPNPDVVCNELIKFKLFYDTAMLRGADYIATGHYARVGHEQMDSERVAATSESRLSPGERGSDLCEQSSEQPDSNRNKESAPEPASEVTNRTRSGIYLLRAADENKDQTYFLYRMSDAATAKTLFPVGNLTKPEVKQLAKDRGLDVATKKESMGICFVGEVGMKDFLGRYLEATPGEIREEETKKVLGFHDGAIFYTIGQRHGLYLGGGLPYYVVAKDLAANIVYVSKNLNHPALWASELKLTNLHLRNGLSIEDLAKMKDLRVRLRHRAALVDVEVTLAPLARGSGLTRRKSGATLQRQASRTRPEQDGANVTQGSIILRFGDAIKRPAPGQSAVLYSGEICLGGGEISA